MAFSRRKKQNGQGDDVDRDIHDEATHDWAYSEVMHDLQPFSPIDREGSQSIAKNTSLAKSLAAGRWCDLGWAKSEKGD